MTHASLPLPSRNSFVAEVRITGRRGGRGLFPAPARKGSAEPRENWRGEGKIVGTACDGGFERSRRVVACVFFSFFLGFVTRDRFFAVNGIDGCV